MRKSGKIVSYLILVIAFTVLMGFMAEGESKTAVIEENKAISEVSRSSGIRGTWL